MSDQSDRAENQPGEEPELDERIPDLEATEEDAEQTRGGVIYDRKAGGKPDPY